MSRCSVSWARALASRPDSRCRATALDSASRNSGKTHQDVCRGVLRPMRVFLRVKFYR